MSVAGFSMAESVYYEEPYTVPGPCKTCCMRCPCPNLITTVVYLIGVAAFCVGIVLASDETVQLFLWNGTLKHVFSDTFLYIKIAAAIGTAVMVILSVLMLAMACLGTGATRKEFVCRFRTRAKGRCQTAVVLTISYVLLLIWIIILVFTLIPTFFFSVQARGICRSARYDGDSDHFFYECLDLRQWGLIDYNPNADKWADPRLPAEGEESYFMCDEELDAMCDSDVLIYYGVTLAGSILVTIALIHYVWNFSANYAKLRDRFKDGYVDKRTGTYLYRTTSARASKRSLAGSKVSLRAGRGSMRNLGSGGIANGGMAPTSASTLKMSAYKNDALKSSREDLYMQELKQTNAANGGYDSNYGGSHYAGSNYGGSNYASSNYSDSNLGINASTAAAPSYRGPPDPIEEEVPPLKQAYLETFNDPQETYNKDRFTNQTSYEANVPVDPVDPYVSSNIDPDQYNSETSYGHTNQYGKADAYSNKLKANVYNDSYGGNLDRNGGYGAKEYDSNRHIGDDLEPSNGYDDQGGFNSTNQMRYNGNSQGSKGPSAAGYSMSLTQDASSRERQEYFI